MINANAKMVAENSGIPLLGTYMVSKYFIDVSMTPDPKNNNTGSHNPFVTFLVVFGFTEVR